MTATTHMDTMYAAFSTGDPDARVTRHRWAKLEPWVLAELRRHGTHVLDVHTGLPHMRSIHADRLAQLIRAGVTPKQILAGKLDSPIPTDADFAAILSRAIRRHRAMLGRKRGHGKGSKYGKGP
jgi:hypothetical protein